MPTPTPGSNESMDDFVRRFMADPAMTREFPDAAQRRAAAQKAWDSEGVREEKIREVTALGGTVDEEGRALLDVAVLGAKSRNGRTYSEGALSSAAAVFEGAKVFLNHRPRGSREPHKVQDFVGRLSGLHRAEGGQVRARRLNVVVEAHWPLVRDLATKDPTAAGLSIVADGETRGKTVTRITASESVDLVSDPAATSGLFEEKENEVNRDEVIASLTLDELRKLREDLVSDVEAVVAKAKDEKLSALEKEVAQLKAGKKKADDDAAVSGKSKTVEGRLRKIVASGVRLSEVQLKAAEALDDEDDLDAFLKEAKDSAAGRRGGPISRGKGDGADLKTGDLREAVIS